MVERVKGRRVGACVLYSLQHEVASGCDLLPPEFPHSTTLVDRGKKKGRG
jgi:hypothetical protein